MSKKELGTSTSDLKSKILKASVSEYAAPISKSKMFEKREVATTPILSLNTALSGELNGGLSAGILMIAGPSKHFKSLLGLIACKAYMDKYEDALMVFYDSEFGTPIEYFDSLGFDTDRIIHKPITDIEMFKTDAMNTLKEINRGDKVVFFVDSLGNMASAKEIDDAENAKVVADMTRAKATKGAFRMMTPHFKLKEIPMVLINHSYMEIGLYPKAVVGGGCVLAGTKIKMADGDLRCVEDVKVGDMVTTHIGYNEVTHVWNPDTLIDGYPDCYKVTFDDGSHITCSESHRFLTESGWKYVTELNDEDILVRK